MAQQGEGRIYHFQTNCVLLGILFSRPYCWNSTFSKFFLVVHNHSCLCSCIRHFSAWFWLFAPLPYCFSEVSSHRPNIHFRIPGPIPCLYACILWCLSCLFFFYLYSSLDAPEFIFQIYLLYPFPFSINHFTSVHSVCWFSFFCSSTQFSYWVVTTQ